MDEIVTLMVGGPLDGQVLALVKQEPHIRAAIPPKMGLRDYIGYHNPEEPITSPMAEYGEVLYVETKLNFFSTILRVHIMQGLPAERMEATLYTHLLSDVGKSLVVSR